MTHAILVRASLILGVSFPAAYSAVERYALVPHTAFVQSPPATANHAKGEFEVALTPRSSEDEQSEPTIGRMLIDKQFRGDLDGTSKGQMLSFMTETKGSAGYVAIERVTAKLAGKSGTFALQHGGTMARGAQKLSIAVVPDSGTGELAGITGTMSIEIAGGKHSYDFEYTLAAR